MRFNKYLFILVTSIFLASSCHNRKEGGVEIIFTQTIDGKPVQFNELIYTNAAGNPYQVKEIIYFISKLRLVNSEGKIITVTQNDGIHYVDCHAENSLKWSIQGIPQGKYVGIEFVFGLDKEDNKSNRFLNPPECNFAWPDPLGGGYHYMQINGFFINRKGELQNLNIHTGIGQIRNENNKVTQFIHNHFTVALPIDLTVSDENIYPVLPLNMEIQRWFDTPNTYNFDDFGSGIMQNQQAQELLRENGGNVFAGR